MHGSRTLRRNGLRAATPPRVRERGHPPGGTIVEAEQDHRQRRVRSMEAKTQRALGKSGVYSLAE